MKTLVESIFDDNTTGDPFKEILDNLDTTKPGGADNALENLAILYKTSGKEYFLYPAGAALERLKTNFANKKSYIAFLRKDYPEDYAFMWFEWGNDNRFYMFYISGVANVKTRWVCNVYTGVNLKSMKQNIGTDGVDGLIDRLQNYGYEYCVFITDQKKIKAIKDRINELVR